MIAIADHSVYINSSLPMVIGGSRCCSRARVDADRDRALEDRGAASERAEEDGNSPEFSFWKATFGGLAFGENMSTGYGGGHKCDTSDWLRSPVIASVQAVSILREAPFTL